MIPVSKIPFGAQPCDLKRSAVEEVAQELAKKVAYAPGDSLEKIVALLGGRIEYVDCLSQSDHSGAIEVRGPGDFTVHIPSFTGPLRDRFTIAHEIGHYVLHSQLGKRPLRVARGGRDQAEWEANWFAAAFLMPEQCFKQYLRDGKDDGELAQIFNVSRAAAEIRRKSLNS